MENWSCEFVCVPLSEKQAITIKFGAEPNAHEIPDF